MPMLRSSRMLAIAPLPTVILSICAFAQTKPSPSQDEPLPFVRTQIVQAETKFSSKAHAFEVSATSAVNGAVCASPPSITDLHAFGHFQQMSKKDAASLNLSFFGLGAGGNWSDQSQVIVWRQGKTNTCLSTDGKYNLIYGSEWDSGLAIAQNSLTGKVSFATIAASVEINNSSTSYDYAAAGYTATSAWETANSTLLKDISTNGLNVTNYATFNNDFGATLSAAASLAPQDPPKVIGYSPVGVTDLAESLAKGYALMYIANERGCLDAIKAFPIKGGWVKSTISGVYLQLSSGKSDCDAKADPTEAPVARQLLSGIKIEKP